jgi:hypothetical protein
VTLAAKKRKGRKCEEEKTLSAQMKNQMRTDEFM